MRKKVLNVAAITNELEGASLFFTQTTKSPAPQPNNTSQTLQPVGENPTQTSEILKTSTEIANERTNEQSNERTNVQTNEASKEQSNERSNGRTNGRSNEEKVVKPKKRTTLRHSFDIYADQLFTLKEIALNREKITAEKVLLGDLAKEALDLLIAREKLK